MPRSNSDADENDSLTSDGEAEVEVPPPRTQAPTVSSPKSATFTHRTGRPNRRRPTMASVPSEIDRSARPIDQFRMAVRKVCTILKLEILFVTNPFI